ncbi:MAG: hypothetical protein IPP83_10245 [Flavobacteriales bacterium]|nr:hypothetical protein [Flavobacteriales bacterium]
MRVQHDDGVLRPLAISAPVRGRKMMRDKEKAFEQERVAVAGAFSINMEFDQQFAMVPLDLAADCSLRQCGERVGDQTATGTSMLEKSCRDPGRGSVDRFHVQPRYQKNALMYRTNATEKCVTFAVLAFIGLIGAFNIIASLTLMMIDKQRDMRTMTGMGATYTFVRRVFFAEGMLIVLTGAVIGSAGGGDLLGAGAIPASWRWKTRCGELPRGCALGRYRDDLLRRARHWPAGHSPGDCGSGTLSRRGPPRRPPARE